MCFRRNINNGSGSGSKYIKCTVYNMTFNGNTYNAFPKEIINEDDELDISLYDKLGEEKQTEIRNYFIKNKIVKDVESNIDFREKLHELKINKTLLEKSYDSPFPTNLKSALELIDSESLPSNTQKYKLFISARTNDSNGNKSLEYYVAKDLYKFFTANKIRTFWWEENHDFSVINAKIAMGLAFSESLIAMSFSNDISCLRKDEKLNYFSYELKTFNDLLKKNTFFEGFESAKKIIKEKRKMIFFCNKEYKIDNYSDYFIDGVSEKDDDLDCNGIILDGKIQDNEKYCKLLQNLIEKIIEIKFNSNNHLIKKCSEFILKKRGVLKKTKKNKNKNIGIISKLKEVLKETEKYKIIGILILIFCIFVDVILNIFPYVPIPALDSLVYYLYYLTKSFTVVGVIIISFIVVDIVLFLVIWFFIFFERKKIIKITKYVLEPLYGLITVFVLIFIIIVNINVLKEKESGVIRIDNSYLIIFDSSTDDSTNNDYLKVDEVFIVDNTSKLPLKYNNKKLSYNKIVSKRDNTSIEFEETPNYNEMTGKLIFSKNITSIIIPKNIKKFNCTFYGDAFDNLSITMPVSENEKLLEKFIVFNIDYLLQLNAKYKEQLGLDYEYSKNELMRPIGELNINGGSISKSTFENTSSYISKINIFDDVKIAEDSFDSMKDIEINMSNSNYNKIKDKVDNEALYKNNVSINCYDLDQQKNRINQEYDVKFITKNDEVTKKYNYGDVIKSGLAKENGIENEYLYYFGDTKIESIMVTRNMNITLKKTEMIEHAVNVTTTGEVETSVTGIGNYLPYSKVELIGTVNEGYVGKWEYDGEVSFGNKLELDMPGENVNIEFSVHKVFDRVDNKIYYGSYPKNLVFDENLISNLNLISDKNPNSWKDYGYYIEGEKKVYMSYIDVDTNQDNQSDYRGVYFTSYRPYNVIESSSTEKSFQDDNGYLSNTIYWFKYEPIEWNIVKEENGKALLISNYIIDAQNFYSSKEGEKIEHNGGTGYVSDYFLSDVKKWLEESFFANSFDYYQKGAVVKSTVIYAKAVGLSANMWLASANDIESFFAREIDRKAQTTDYAKSQGLENYAGLSSWYLCTSSTSNGVNYVGTSGKIYSGVYEDILVTRILGIRPLCWINLC